MKLVYAIILSFLSGQVLAQDLMQNGCSQLLSFTIEQENEILVNDITVLDVSCHAYQDGSVQVVMPDDGVDYSYSLSGQSNDTGLFSELSAGDYKLIIQNDIGCTYEESIVINEPNPIELMVIEANLENESDGYIITQVQGGTGPYRFSKDNGASFQEDSVFVDLTSSTYTLIVEDANGCRDEVVVELTDLIELNDHISMVNLYPNPVSDRIMITGNTQSSYNLDYSIYDDKGATLYLEGSEMLNSGYNVINIKLDYLHPGIYLILLKSPQSSIAKKIIVIN